MIQYGGLFELSKPTISTPWSTWLEMQFVMMPLVYVCHEVASTPTDRGPFVPTQAAIWSSFWAMFS